MRKQKKAFSSLGDFSDSAAKIEECNSIIKQKSDYDTAVSYQDSGKYEQAIEIFKTLGAYSDSKERIDACNKALEDAKVTKMTATMYATMSMNVRSGPSTDYDKIGKLDENEKVSVTGKTSNGWYRIELDGKEGYVSGKYLSIKVGSYIKLGHYEQDNNTSNGKETIEWLVLDKKDGKALVISKYALDCQQYNTRYTNVTWETCSLRKWLNSTFINAAFTNTEKSLIPTVTVSADKNPECSTNPGNATQDKVFLLSITEVNKYFSSDSARQCKVTAYAEAQGAYVSSSNGGCWWWLRSPGYYQYNVAYVYYGDVRERGNGVHSSHNAVRPAMWIEIGE